MVKNQFGDTAINVNQFGDVATGTTGTPQTQDAFFANLKNPIDLWKYESLPMSAYYYATGNTKQKQAIEARDYIAKNPNQIGTSEYKRAEKIMEMYGHHIDSQPFNPGAIVEAVKSNPKMFGAEMVNMLVADPYLLAPWFWGGWAMKAVQATKSGAKIAAAAPRITNATVRSIGSVPTLAAYSSIHDLSEDGHLNPRRLGTEIAIGGSAMFGMSALFAGSTAKASGILGMKPEEITPAMRRAINNYWTNKLGPEKAKPFILNESNTVASIESATKALLSAIEDGGIGFNPNVWKTIKGNTFKQRQNYIKEVMSKDKEVTSAMSFNYLKEPGIFRNKKSGELFINKSVLQQQFSKDPLKKYFKDLDDYIDYKAEVVRLKNNTGYANRSKYNEQNIKDIALDNHNKRSLDMNKWKEAVVDELRPFVQQEYRNLAITNNTRWYHLRNLQALKAPAMVGTIAGVASQVINPDNDNSFWTAALIGSGAVGSWKVASGIIARNNSLKAGLKVTGRDGKAIGTTDEIGTRLDDIRKSLPKDMKLEDLAISKQPSFYRNTAIKNSDLRKLGRAEEIELSKSKFISNSLLEDYNTFYRTSMIDVSRIFQLMKAKVPDEKGGEAITKYLQGNKDIKLTKPQLEVARDIRKILDGMWKSLDGSELQFRYHQNFLPQYWNWKGMGDATIQEQIQELIKNVGKPPSLKGFSSSEFQKIFPTYEAGIKAGLKPITSNALDIMALYIDSTTRAIGQRRLVGMIQQAYIPGRADGSGGLAKLMYDRNKLPSTLDPGDYVEFYHPAFIDRKIDVTKLTKTQKKEVAPFVFREAAPMLRMLFDAREEGAVLKAISQFNFLQKRFSVGYSFFHAGALLQSSVYMSMHPISAGKLFASALGLGNLPGFKYFIPKWKDNTAQKMLMADGDGDMLKAATRAGVQFSHPEDIGFNQFYRTWSGAKNYLDKHPTFISYLAKAGIENLVEKPFKYIDMVTWDRVFNAGKLYAWQTNVMKLLNNPKFKDAPLNEIYKQAAIVTNDGYGGLNWQQLYMSTSDPILKKMKEHAYNPTGRKWMQRIMFAPDWTTANFRIISRAFPGVNENAMSRKLYEAYTIRAALIVGTGGAALQYMFTGTNIMENRDPTRVDLGNGYSISLSKQLFEPLHWATEPYKYAVAKQSSILKSTEQALFNKKFLTSPWPSPISKADLLSLQRAYDYAGFYGMTFVPFSFRQIVQEIADEGGITVQDAIGEILRSLGGLTGYPIYPIGRKGA